MPKCPKCKTENPKQFMSVKTAREQYQQCKTCGLRISDKDTSKILSNSLSLTEEQTHVIRPFDPYDTRPITFPLTRKENKKHDPS